jgi:hypothetical protein
MLMAVESGALTATLFIVTIILLLSVRDQPAAVGVELCLGRAYANTLLCVCTFPSSARLAHCSLCRYNLYA